jgi:hypothetical protein
VLGIETDAVLEARAIAKLSPGKVRGAFDLPLFLAELKDFSEVWKRVGRHLRRPPKVPKSVYAELRQLTVPFGRNVPAGATLRARNTLKRLVGTDLAWTLMVKPFLDGMGQIGNLLSSFDSSYSAFKNEAVSVLLGKSVSQGTVPLSDQVSTWKQTGSYTRTVTAVAFMKIARDTSAVTQLDFARGLFRLSPRLVTGWDIIPLSFLVDMFVDIGGFLAQFDGTELEVPYKVLSTGVSIKRETKAECQLHLLGGASTYVTDRPPDLRIEGKRVSTDYVRAGKSINLADGMLEPIKLRLPNLGQVKTILEIISANLLR